MAVSMSSIALTSSGSGGVFHRDKRRLVKNQHVMLTGGGEACGDAFISSTWEEGVIVGKGSSRSLEGMVSEAMGSFG